MAAAPVRGLPRAGAGHHHTDDVILQHNLIVEAAALVEMPFTAEGLVRGVRELLDN